MLDEGCILAPGQKLSNRRDAAEVGGKARQITGVLTILSPKPRVTPEQVMKIMPAEIRATVPLYLDGKIQQWFTRGDGRGVIFILNCKDVAEARDLIESLPLSKENLVDEQFIPVGPLLPLGILLRDSPTNK
jgi:hypothetical protein